MRTAAWRGCTPSDLRLHDRGRMAQARLDGVLKLDVVASELTHETFEVDTKDREDHTFSGIMFDVACQSRPQGRAPTPPPNNCSNWPNANPNLPQCLRHA